MSGAGLGQAGTRESGERAPVRSADGDDGHVWESPLPEGLTAVPPDALPAAPPRRSILEHGWWSVVAWTAGMFLGARALADNSFLTHLATGRIIRSTGAPTADVYTFASAGKPLVVQSWLASWWYASLEAAGGPNAIRLFVAAVCGVLLLTLWRVSAPAGSLLGRIGLTAMAGMVGLLWWSERPQIVGFLVLALVALVLQERRSPALLVPLFAVWVNVHGSFPLGVLFVGSMLLLGAVAARRVTTRDLAVVSATLAGLLLGAALSPYGMQMLTFPVELLGKSKALQFITEWRPISFTIDGVPNTNNIVFVAEAVAIGALLVWRRSWLRLAVAAVFVGMSVAAVRNVAIASLVLIPLVAPVLAGLGTPDTVARPPRMLRISLGALATAVVAAYVVLTPAYDWEGYPTRAVDWMEAHGYVGTGPDEPAILTHDYVGNYLEWRYGPGANVWLDDRAELHDFAVARDYVYLLSNLGDADRILARWPHDLVLWQADSRFAKHLVADDDYRIVYRDADSVVACRVASTRC